MQTRLLLPAIALSLLLASLASAQTPPAPNPDQEALQQQMQDMRQQMMDNMQKQGVDPMQYFQDMGRRMQDGSLDFSQLQQELIDKGFVDQATVDKLTASVQKVTFSTLKQQLGATDDEWAAIQPKIQLVLAAQSRVTTGPTGFGGLSQMGGFNAKELGPNPVPPALTALKLTIKDTNATNEEIAAKLKALRDAKQAAKDTLANAQKALSDILTVRQEAILSKLGMLP